MNSRKAVVLTLVLFLSPLIVYFILPSEESRIRKLFSEGDRAIKTENIDALMARISFNYRDDHGLSYLVVRRAMENFFRQWSDISTEYSVRDLQIQDGKASAELEVRVVATSGQDTGYIIGDAVTPLVVRVELEKEKTKWVVVSTRGMPGIK